MDDERFRAVLQRAEEIQAQNAATVIVTEDMNTMVDAAVEAGLSREAVSQALQERLSLETVTHTIGELVFALSADGFSYPARIRSIDGEIVEVVAITALNVFTNYLNRVAETDIDFPVVRSGIGAAA